MLECNFKEILKSGKCRCNLTCAGEFGKIRKDCIGQDKCIVYQTYVRLMLWLIKISGMTEDELTKYRKEVGEYDS